MIIVLVKAVAVTEELPIEYCKTRIVTNSLQEKNEAARR